MGKGQAWSMDLVIGMLIFLLTIGIIYSLLTAQAREDSEPLRIESEVIATKLTSDPTLNVANSNILSMAKLVSLAERSETDYYGLKKELGIEHEFCIYLLDENNNLAYITNGTHNYTGIGPSDPALNISSIQCGCKFNINNPSAC